MNVYHLPEKWKSYQVPTPDFSKTDLPLVWITREGICVVGPTANQVLLFAHFRRRHGEEEEKRRQKKCHADDGDFFFSRGRSDERTEERTEERTDRQRGNIIGRGVQGNFQPPPLPPRPAPPNDASLPPSANRGRRRSRILTRLMRSPSSYSADLMSDMCSGKRIFRTGRTPAPALTHSLFLFHSEKRLDSARFPNNTDCAGRNALILPRAAQRRVRQRRWPHARASGSACKELPSRHANVRFQIYIRN